MVLYRRSLNENYTHDVILFAGQDFEEVLLYIEVGRCAKQPEDEDKVVNSMIGMCLERERERERERMHFQ